MKPALTVEYFQFNRNPLKDYLTVEEAMDILERSDTAIKNWARDELEAQQLAVKAGTWRIHKSALPLYKQRPGAGRPKKKQKD